ncbi:WD40 repeat domain-containing protein [Thalassotalea castellviae]|uniref:WD40 repeat domain-containing protein n=1 Tax=Thalassotalea castellviae TaxID=3075612 RepID=A0ABU3A417_9GAMM|nr:WD40 repeat domain-containing protein [Thalassotalea sp. W431]MDT0604909.1 WD40 repeat domain-containing protein [Thalassotalea sp. W431]
MGNVLNKMKIYQTLLFVLTLLLSVLLLGCEKPNLLLANEHHQLTQAALIDGDLSNDGQYSVILDIKNNLSLWQNSNYTLIKQWPSSLFPQQQYYVVLSNNQQWLAVAGKHSVTLLSVNSKHKPLTWEVNGFDRDAEISQILINSIGNKVIIGLTEGSVVVVDITNGLRSQFALHDGPVNHLIFSDNEQKLVSASLDGQAIKWDLASGKVIWSNEQPFRITSLAFDDLSQRLFVSDALNNQTFFSLNKGQEISSLSYFERNRYFREAIFISGAKKLLTSSSKYQISLWDVMSGNEISQGEIKAYNFGSTVLDFAVNEQNDVITLSSDAVLELWPAPLFK